MTSRDLERSRSWVCPDSLEPQYLKIPWR